MPFSVSVETFISCNCCRFLFPCALPLQKMFPVILLLRLLFLDLLTVSVSCSRRPYYSSRCGETDVLIDPYSLSPLLHHVDPMFPMQIAKLNHRNFSGSIFGGNDFLGLATFVFKECILITSSYLLIHMKTSCSADPDP